MNIEENLTDEKINSVQNKDLKEYLFTVKKKLVNKEQIDPTVFLKKCQSLMGQTEKNTEMASKLFSLNKNVSTALDVLKNIQI